MEPRELYDDAYSEVYRALYIDHPMWHDKHDTNSRLLGELLRPGASWLDTCCGQAWHFTQAGDGAKTGIDVSAAQLARARAANPDARFLEGDVLAVELPEQFAVVTNFWGAYSYLDDLARITAFVHRLVDWTASGGSLYLELITPATLEAFNQTGFADNTGARVKLRSPDGVAWSYHDPGGWHDLTSPPVAAMHALLVPWFERVESRGLVATMDQLIATGRSDQRVIDRHRG